MGEELPQPGTPDASGTPLEAAGRFVGEGMSVVGEGMSAIQAAAFLQYARMMGWLTAQGQLRLNPNDPRAQQILGAMRATSPAAAYSTIQGVFDAMRGHIGTTYRAVQTLPSTAVQTAKTSLTSQNSLSTGSSLLMSSPIWAPTSTAIKAASGISSGLALSDLERKVSDAHGSVASLVEQEINAGNIKETGGRYEWIGSDAAYTTFQSEFDSRLQAAETLEQTYARQTESRFSFLGGQTPFSLMGSLGLDSTIRKYNENVQKTSPGMGIIGDGLKGLAGLGGTMVTAFDTATSPHKLHQYGQDLTAGYSDWVNQNTRFSDGVWGSVQAGAYDIPKYLAASLSLPYGVEIAARDYLDSPSTHTERFSQMAAYGLASQYHAAAEDPVRFGTAFVGSAIVTAGAVKGGGIAWRTIPVRPGLASATIGDTAVTAFGTVRKSGSVERFEPLISGSKVSGEKWVFQRGTPTVSLDTIPKNKPYLPKSPLETRLVQEAVGAERLKIQYALDVRQHTQRAQLKLRKGSEAAREVVEAHGIPKSRVVADEIVRTLAEHDAQLYGSVVQRGVGRERGQPGLLRTPRDFDVQVPTTDMMMPLRRSLVERVNRIAGEETLILHKKSILVKKTGEKLFDVHSADKSAYGTLDGGYLGYGLRAERAARTAEGLKTITISEQASRKLRGAINIYSEVQVFSKSMEVGGRQLEYRGRIAPEHKGRTKDIGDFYLAEKLGIAKLETSFNPFSRKSARKADTALESWLDQWGDVVASHIREQLRTARETGIRIEYNLLDPPAIPSKYPGRSTPLTSPGVIVSLSEIGSPKYPGYPASGAAAPSPPYPFGTYRPAGRPAIRSYRATSPTYKPDPITSSGYVPDPVPYRHDPFPPLPTNTLRLHKPRYPPPPPPPPPYKPPPNLITRISINELITTPGETTPTYGRLRRRRRDDEQAGMKQAVRPTYFSFMEFAPVLSPRDAARGIIPDWVRRQPGKKGKKSVAEPEIQYRSGLI